MTNKQKRKNDVWIYADRLYHHPFDPKLYVTRDHEDPKSKAWEWPMHADGWEERSEFHGDVSALSRILDPYVARHTGWPYAHDPGYGPPQAGAEPSLAPLLDEDRPFRPRARKPMAQLKRHVTSVLFTTAQLNMIDADSGRAGVSVGKAIRDAVAFAYAHGFRSVSVAPKR